MVRHSIIAHEREVIAGRFIALFFKGGIYCSDKYTTYIWGYKIVPL